MNKLQRYEERRQGFNNTLRQFELTEEQIFLQNLDQLDKSLQTIDQLINNDIEKIEEIHGIILLERKKIILSRIQEISSNKKIENLQGLVGQLSEGEIKDKLSEELKALLEESQKYRQEIQAASETETKIKLEQQRLDGLERKSKIWLSFLQRESAASLIGAIVLLLLTLALIFGKESQILSNGFLVILGYFFGQSSSRTRQDNSKPASPNKWPDDTNI